MTESERRESTGAFLRDLANEAASDIITMVIARLKVFEEKEGHKFIESTFGGELTLANRLGEEIIRALELTIAFPLGYSLSNVRVTVEEAN